jgi:hypothetical protein
VLTDGAVLPSETDLPADIAALARCQYRRLRAGDVVADLDRLHRDLIAADPALRKHAGTRPSSQRAWGKPAWRRPKQREWPPAATLQTLLPDLESGGFRSA